LNSVQVGEEERGRLILRMTKKYADTSIMFFLKKSTKTVGYRTVESRKI
jgi:hypothetical protein